MKKLLALSTLCAAVLTTPLAQANDGWFSIGKATEASGNGLSVAIGMRGKGNWGFAFGGIFNADYSESNVLNYPVPHNSFTSLGTKRVGNSLGVDALYFLNPEDRFKTYLGLGVYYAPKKDLAQSNLTGWVYTQKDQSSTSLSAEIGTLYTTDSKLLVGFGLHSVRGATFSIGKTF